MLPVMALLKKTAIICGMFSMAKSKPKKDSPLSAMLISIYQQLSEVITQTAPQAIALENIFYGKNVRSLIKQAQVRGVVIFAGADKGILIFEYSPLEVKKAVVGYGRAEKRQVQING